MWVNSYESVIFVLITHNSIHYNCTRWPIRSATLFCWLWFGSSIMLHIGLPKQSQQNVVADLTDHPVKCEDIVTKCLLWHFCHSPIVSQYPIRNCIWKLYLIFHTVVLITQPCRITSSALWSGGWSAEAPPRLTHWFADSTRCVTK